jgi:hypothetical protein
MVMVSAIALMADVSVGWQCQLLIQLESEDTAVWESMSLALPSVAPPTTAQHRALSLGARHVEVANSGQRTRLSTQLQTEEKIRCCEAQRCHEVSCRSSVAGCDVVPCVDGVVTVL